MSFRQAYQKTTAIVNFAEKKNKQLNELTLDEFKIFEPKLTNEVFNVLKLEYSIKSKKSFGGTSFDNVKKMIMKYKKQND